MQTTPRLEINYWTEDLASAFYELTQDKGFNLFPITIYRQSSLQSSREWVQKMALMNQETSLGKFAVLEKQSGQLIGMGGLTPWDFEGEQLIDITYRLRESAWGHGYGFELANGLVRYGFEKRGLAEITATITPDNLASKKIAEKLGMKFERKILLLGVNTELYRLRRSELAALQ